MSSEHYFSKSPAGDLKLKEISVELNESQVNVVTAGGVFSPDHIDRGTEVLFQHLSNAPASGNILDIGCGWGPIALSLAMHSPKATVWAIDVNERSLELTAANASRLGLKNIRCAQPHEVPAEIEFAGIWSNPPIRVGKDVLHEILLTWLPRLKKGADAWLVVQKNLGSDSLLRWLDKELPENFSTSRVDSSKSFRVLRVENN